MSHRAAEPSPRPCAGQAQASKPLRPLLHSPSGSDGGAGPRGSTSTGPQQLECMAPPLRSQLQPASVSPFTLQKLIQLRSAVYPLGGGRGQRKVARPLPIMTSGPPLWVELFSKNGNCCELGTNMMGICSNMYSY